MNPTVKKIGISLIVVVLVYCLLSIGFYGVVAMNFGKTINHVVEAGEIKDTYIWEVEYWSNVNGNGVELLDIRINGFLDADEIDKEDAMLYSKGIQIVGDTYESINFSVQPSVKASSVILSFLINPLFTGYDFDIYYNSNYKLYYYDTQNGVSFKSIENLDTDSFFKVPIKSNGVEELYLMKLLGLSNVPTNEEGTIFKRRFYENYDVNYAAAKILGASRHNNIGYDATGSLVADFGDCFIYRKYSDTSGDWITSKETDLYTVIKENFCAFKLTTHSDGANYGSDSMFGMVANSADYEYLPENYIDDYFVGKQVLTLTEDNFASNEGELVLLDSTVKFLSNNKDKNISVIIDTEALKNKGITYKNMSADFIAEYRSRLVSIKIKTVNDTGEIIYTEILI